MRNKLEKTADIRISFCDNHARLSLPGLFALFMDMASAHGDELGLGMDVLAEKGLIWVAAKTRILIHEQPPMLSEVEVATWPEAPGRLRCNRYYTLRRGSRLLAEGKTEWIMLEQATGRLARTEGNYPSMEHCPDVVCDLPFSRLDDHFDDCPVLGQYHVCSGDIDTSQHMNNVQYVRALMGMLTTAQIDGLGITGAEAIFRIQCFEGETLTICTRPWEEGIDLAARKADGKTAMILRLTCTGRLA